jgi:hypothetical protein
MLHAPEAAAGSCPAWNLCTAVPCVRMHAVRADPHITYSLPLFSCLPVSKHDANQRLGKPCEKAIMDHEISQQQIDAVNPDLKEIGKVMSLAYGKIGHIIAMAKLTDEEREILCVSAFGVMSTFADMMNVEAKKISLA